jgi:hypothetical protein
LISDAILNHDIFPVAIAPEGKTSSGDFLFRFRTGGFLTDEMIQPVTLRYSHWFPIANITMNSLPRSVWERLFLCLCVPLGSCDITYLEPIGKDVLAEKTPEERADLTQLRMANSLGTLASARSSREIFGIKEKEE